MSKSLRKRQLEKTESEIIVRTRRRCVNMSTRQFSYSTGGVKTYSSSRSRYDDKFQIHGSCMDHYLNFVSKTPLIKEFLRRDPCFVRSDNYLLATVFKYVTTIHPNPKGLENSLNTKDFFSLLYLAIEMEEDEPCLRWECLAYITSLTNLKKAIARRKILWAKMDFRALVSKKVCDKIMSLRPHHPIWKRIRDSNHGGAYRELLFQVDENGYYQPEGPYQKTIQPCPICHKVVSEEIGYNLDLLIKQEMEERSDDEDPSTSMSLNTNFQKEKYNDEDASGDANERKIYYRSDSDEEEISFPKYAKIDPVI